MDSLHFRGGAGTGQPEGSESAVAVACGRPAAGSQPPCLGTVATELEALARRISDLSASGHHNGQFVQLDLAARDTLAAAQSLRLMAEGGRPLSELQHPPAVPERGNPSRIHPELASKLIRRIFAAGLQLAALQSLLGEGPLSDRTALVVEELDGVIHDVRAGALD